MHKEIIHQSRLKNINSSYKSRKHTFRHLWTSCSVCGFPIKNKFQEDHPLDIPTKFGSNWHSGCGEEDYKM